MILSAILSVYFFLLFAGYLSDIVVWLINHKEKKKNDIHTYPFISILIAARNEEANIKDCLKAIEGLDYPKDSYEILIGDDQSQDDTYNVVANFIKEKSNYRLFKINGFLGVAKGKSNVLAHLSKEAKGDYYFITDADIEVPKSWVKSILSEFEEGTGIISGCTIVRGNKLLHSYQTLDWVYAFGMIKNTSFLGIPVSAVGNNMAISADAYKSTGGYEKIPFSIIEDLALFKAVLKEGWGYKNLVNKEVLAISKPLNTIGELLHQRKRWMRGAVQLNKLMVTALSLRALFLPAVVILLVINPFMGVVAWLMKILLQDIFILLVLKDLNKMRYLKFLGVFEVFYGFINTLLLVFYCLPVKINWKGRKY